MRHLCHCERFAVLVSYVSLFVCPGGRLAICARKEKSSGRSILSRKERIGGMRGGCFCGNERRFGSVVARAVRGRPVLDFPSTRRSVLAGISWEEGGLS